MDFLLTDEQLEMKKLAKEIAETVIKPSVKKSDKNEEVPFEVIKELYDAGFGAIVIDEKYEGIGGSFLDFAIVIKELSKVCAATSLTLIGSILGALPIILFGSEEQKKKYLPKIASGEYIAALAISESEAGSDIGAMKTNINLDGEGIVLNGRKRWITNGSIADLYVVIARDNSIEDGKKFSAVVIENGTEGLSFGSKEEKLGMRASATTDVIFENCKIPIENIIGENGQGLKIALKALDYSRAIIAAQAIGIAEGAYDDALNYSNEREQFNKKIYSFQSIQNMLVEMYMKIESGNLSLYKACYMIDNNKEDDINLNSALCKVLCSDIAMSVTVDSIQIFGGYGCTCDYPVEKRMRDSKITQIYEGTNQILRNVIAKNIVRTVRR